MPVLGRLILGFELLFLHCCPFGVHSMAAKLCCLKQTSQSGRGAERGPSQCSVESYGVTKEGSEESVVLEGFVVLLRKDKSVPPYNSRNMDGLRFGLQG